jgi:alcohol dehydrogenase class IV
MVLGGASMGLHHKLCHVLGGSFDLPHAETHTVVLPHVLAYNAPAAEAAIARVGRALASEHPAAALFDLAKRAGVPTSLRELGMPADQLGRAADLATAKPYANPRPPDRDAVRALLDDAWNGRRPLPSR